MHAVWIYLAVINAVTLILFADDKRRARRHKWRIREAVLLGFSAAGGACGGLAGMLLCHHKIRKWYFVVLVPTFIIAHLAVLILLHRQGIV